MPRVIDVGNCGFDHSSLSGLLQQHFQVPCISVANGVELQRELKQGDVALVIVNRVFDSDGGDGVALIEQLKQQPTTAALPVMLLSNYADAQEKAVALGALPGFGKSSLRSDATRELLKGILQPG
jgi:two-component system chemotaxis response regulator CheY